MNLTFDFSDAGLTGSPSEPAAQYRLLKRSASTGDFTDITVTSGATVSIDGDRVIFSSVNVAQLGSFFTLGSTSGALPVTLSYFLATPSGDGIHFAWQTATETGNAGFNLNAETEAGRQRLNDELIPSAVIDSVEPQDYVYEATGVTGEIFYIELIDIAGSSELHGPFALGVPHGSRVEANPAEQGNQLYLPSVQGR